MNQIRFLVAGFITLLPLAAAQAENSSTETAKQADSNQLIVQDCSGAVRAATQLEIGMKSRVVAKLLNTNSAQPHVLSSNDSTIKAKTAENGTVTFDDVASGNWKLCSADSTASSSIDWVSISQSSASSSMAAPVVVGGSLIGAGVAILGLSGSSGGSSDSDREPGTPLLANPESNSLERFGQDAAGQQVQAATECVNNRTPDPISAFF